MVTGATGFIGRRLLAELDRPIVLARNPERAKATLGDAEVYMWEPETAPPPQAAFQGIGAIFHLAGESVAGGRWNEEKKRRIRESRVAGTRNLVNAIERLRERPSLLISASAIGFYGNRGDAVLDESSATGNDFLAGVCRDWEAEAQRAGAFGLRVVTPRIGIVLGKGGGALATMLLPFRLGLGGRLGSGRHWMSWIHLDDLIGLFRHVAENESISGPINAVAPNPTRDIQFAQALATALHRPAILPVPEFALRLAFGELASVLLSSQRVAPRVAQQTGYQFRYPGLSAALRAIVGG